MYVFILEPNLSFSTVAYYTLSLKKVVCKCCTNYMRMWHVLCLVIHYIRIIRSCCTCPDSYLLNYKTDLMVSLSLNMPCHVYRHFPNTVKKKVHTGILAFLTKLFSVIEYARISPYLNNLLTL